MAKSNAQFWERVTCSVDDVVMATGLGRTKIYELLSKNDLRSIRVGRRRLIIVASVRQLIESAE